MFSPLPSETELQAQNVMEYFLKEVEQDDFLTREEQHDKIAEFKAVADDLSSEAAALLTHLLLEETRARVVDMINHAGLDETEVQHALAQYDQAILNVQKMDVETARQMLFFVAELKIHRQYVYEYGIALGAPEEQLLRHDLCKLNAVQFEGYVRYFRGGLREEDKLGYLLAWEEHQHEEHHYESYTKDGFDFDTFPEERLRNNMREATADLLAATKQRKGTTAIEWLLYRFPNKNPDPRLIPYLEEALIKAHTLYLENEKNPGSYTLFEGLPCWNEEIAEVFRELAHSQVK